jgi:hypothetical protein
MNTLSDFFLGVASTRFNANLPALFERLSPDIFGVCHFGLAPPFIAILQGRRIEGVLRLGMTDRRITSDSLDMRTSRSWSIWIDAKSLVHSWSTR